MVVWIAKQYVSITFNNSKEKQMSVRDEYVKKMHSRLDQLNHEIDKLAASKDQIGEKGHAEFAKHMDELRARRDEAKVHLKEIQQAGESAWEDLKAGAELAWESIAQAIESARTRFK